MLNQKSCVYHTNKNCFIYLGSNLRSTRLNEKVRLVILNFSKILAFSHSFKKDVYSLKKSIFEVLIGKERQAFFSVLFLDSSQQKFNKQNEDVFYLNSFYAKRLKINENDTVKFKKNQYFYEKQKSKFTF
jgi:hypothetical protein